MTRLAPLPLAAAVLLLACGEDLGPRIPAAIVVAPAAPKVAPGDTLRLSAKVVDAAGDPIDGHSIAFRSSDETVLKIDDAGLLTAVAFLVGRTARITATSGDISAEVEATIGLPPSSLVVRPRLVELDPGEQGLLAVILTDADGQEIPDASFTFVSSDPTIVTVQASGLGPGYLDLKALALGTSSITVTGGGMTTVVPVTVKRIPYGAFVTPTDLVLSPGASQQATAVLLDRSGDEMDLSHPFTWSSSNGDVVTVSSAGMVSSAGPEGSAIITATVDAFTAQLRVFVGTPPAGEKLAHVPVEAAAGLALTSDGRYFVSSYGTFLGGQLPDFAFPIQVPTEGWANDIVLNPTGTRAYLIGMGPGVIVVDLATNAVVDSIPVHLGVDYDGAQSGAFSADGSILTVGTRVGFEVIDLASKKSLGGTTVGFVGKLIHHPSRPVLYAPCQTGMFELDEKSGAIIRRFPGGGYDGAVVSPDGATLYAVAFGGEGAAVWDLATGALTRTLGGIEGTDMAISPDGRFLYVIRGGFDFDNRLRIYDAASGTMVRNVSLGGLTRRLALAADGTAIITNENSTGDPGWVDFVR